ncbi:MAG: Co2+/Mg2+ efflux protein ApaG [Bdellovibrionaceae bacterium]|nr:Co2+/Mg2+ efflux protein ApaG [Pseudobdellovibrionaceae bacterium]
MAKFEIIVRTKYIESESNPESSYYFFSYKIQIRNQSLKSAQLISRHWIISDAQGRIEEVKGPGVVGLQPKIKPKEVFEYESSCPLTTSSGSMKGFYNFLTEDGEEFSVEIPEFFLISPSCLH